MKATLRLKLHTDPTIAATLHETMRQSTACFNAVCQHGWEHEERNGVRLHKATYRPLRKRFEHLPSQLVVSARSKATEALKSGHAHRRQGRALPCPHSECGAIRYDARSYWVQFPKGQTALPPESVSVAAEGTSRWVGMASLATVCGRVHVPFYLPACYRPYATWKSCSADLCFRDGAFFLHVVVETATPALACEGVLGVDLGIAEIAVDSDGTIYSGAAIKAVRQRVKRLRGLLQRKGTKSAKRHFKKIARRQSRFMRDTNHVVSKQLVRTALLSRKAIALEDLSGLRERASVSRDLRWLLGNWAFHQLRAFVAYKAEAAGLPVVTVDPAYTSRTCSGCGHCARGNRKSQSQFVCLRCGLTLNADFNAALNVKTRAEMSDGLLCPAGASASA